MELLAFVPLAFMIRSDYKERVIRIYPLLFFGILTVTGSVWRWGWEESTCRGRCGGIGISDGRGITLFVTEIPKKDKSVS